MPTLASLLAAAYAVLVSAMLYMAHGGGSPLRLLKAFGQPGYWVAIVLAAVIAWGIAKRYAWAWWLGGAAALFQLYRLADWYLQGRIGRMPGALTLAAFVLLAAFLVLLAQRKVRTACTR